MPPKSTFIRIGDFFFKFRNMLFPALLAVVFFTYEPAEEYFGSHLAEQLKDCFAVIMVFIGLGMRAAVIGYAYIKRGGLNKQVYADTLVTGGFFAASRNPLYVGNMTIYVGVFLMHGNPYVFVVGSLVMYAIYSSIIAAEEYFLRSKFGTEFDLYCAQTPRWLPRLGNLRPNTSGMEFNWKRVIVKDYSTIVNSCIALIIVEGIEDWQEAGAGLRNVPMIAIIMIVVLLLAAMAISYAKKKRWLTA